MSRLPRAVYVVCFTVIALLVAAGQPTAAAARGPNDADEVLTHDGPVRGANFEGMHAFLGIPYAAPPVGARRWQPPAPPTAWVVPRPATKFGNHCPQAASPFGVASLTEDCLYLNVFVPSDRHSPGVHQPYPVMVWIHGGGFTSGESDDYNPDRLVARGVIVVTLNYRLGLLGFLAQHALDREPHAHVNYGLMDQQAALRWVRANIAAFGGNPWRTTVFGQSAGGLSVFAQLASPAAFGLFSGAIVQSGAYGLKLPSVQVSETLGSTFAASAHCPDADAACLRALPLPLIVATGAGLNILPTVDGTVIPLSPDVALALGLFSHVSTINGSNHDEFRLYTALDFDLAGARLSAAKYPGVVASQVGAIAAPQVLAHYPLTRYAGPDLAFAAFGTDAAFSCRAFAADLALSRFVPTYAYEFADENAPQDFLPPVSFPYAAAHGSEIPFLFDFFNRALPLSAAERELAERMVGDWTRFARSGRPDGWGDVRAGQWQRFDPNRGDIEAFAAPRPHLSYTFGTDHQCAFWSTLADSIRTSSSKRARPPAASPGRQ